MFLLELWPSCLVKSSRSPRFILSCFATHSALSNRTKVLYPDPHHNFISPRRGSSLLSSTLACLRARPKPPCCAGYKFIFFCHSLQRWERQSWKYQARDSHEKQINGPEGPPEGTVSRKPKIFSSFTQRDEEADRNIPSIYPLFVDQDQRLTLLTTQVKTYTWLLLCFRHNIMGGGGGGYLLIRG